MQSPSQQVLLNIANGIQSFPSNNKTPVEADINRNAYPKSKDYNQLNELATGLRFRKYHVDHAKRFVARTADSREEASRFADWTKLHREFCKEAVKENPTSI